MAGERGAGRPSNHIEPGGAVAIAQHYIRELVYGANDGVITTFAVVAGVSGGGLSMPVVLVIGAANLFADGLSMAVGNYLKTKTDHEVLDRYPWAREQVDAYFGQGEEDAASGPESETALEPPVDARFELIHEDADLVAVGKSGDIPTSPSGNGDGCSPIWRRRSNATSPPIGRFTSASSIPTRSGWSFRRPESRALRVSSISLVCTGLFLFSLLLFSSTSRSLAINAFSATHHSPTGKSSSA